MREERARKRGKFRENSGRFRSRDHLAWTSVKIEAKGSHLRSTMPIATMSVTFFK